MKLTIEQAALQKALSRATGVAARRTTIPILTNLLIDAQTDAADEQLWLIATDLDMEVRVRVEARIETPGQITVPADLLDKIARAAPAGADVQMQYDRAADARVQVRFGRNRYNLPALPAGDFPVFPEGRWAAPATVGAADLALILDRTAFAISRDQTRTYLLGAFLHPCTGDAGRVLRSSATDGHRMACADCRATMPDDMRGAIVPAKTVAEFRRAIEGRVGPVQLHLSATGARLEMEDLILTSKVIEGEFVDYTRVIPRDWRYEIRVDRDLFHGAVRRTAFMATDRAPSLKLALNDGAIRLTVRNSEAGQAEEEVEAEHDADGIEVSVNARYFQDALAQTSADRIVLRFEDPGSPLRLEPEPEDAEAGLALSVVMPMRF
ncbi:MAG TPA: DNA polymerase III subunit beta [Brevundimonas diminuta]|nr:DNA polymerase III subunit beta [Brevundimonas diminuta]